MSVNGLEDFTAQQTAEEKRDNKFIIKINATVKIILNKVLYRSLNTRLKEIIFIFMKGGGDNCWGGLPPFP